LVVYTKCSEMYLLIVLGTSVYHICSPIVILLHIMFALHKSDYITEKSTLELGQDSQTHTQHWVITQLESELVHNQYLGTQNVIKLI